MKANKFFALALLAWVWAATPFGARGVETKPGKKEPGKELPRKKAHGKAARLGDFIYLKMPKTVADSIRRLEGEGVPDVTAVINGIKVTPLENMIKTPHNVITSVSNDGAAREVMVNAGEKKILRLLGAEAVAPPGAPADQEHWRVEAKGFLQIEIPHKEPSPHAGPGPAPKTSELVEIQLPDEKEPYVFFVVDLPQKADKAEKNPEKGEKNHEKGDKPSETRKEQPAGGR